MSEDNRHNDDDDDAPSEERLPPGLETEPDLDDGLAWRRMSFAWCSMAEALADRVAELEKYLSIVKEPPEVRELRSEVTTGNVRSIEQAEEIDRLESREQELLDHIHVQTGQYEDLLKAYEDMSAAATHHRQRAETLVQDYHTMADETAKLRTHVDIKTSRVAALEAILNTKEEEL